MFFEHLKIRFHYLQGLIEAFRMHKNFEYNKDMKSAFVMLAANYNNLGDIAITKSQVSFLKEVLPDDYQVIVVPYEDTYKVFLFMKRIIKSNSIITLIGGGNSGSEYEFIEQPRRFILKYFRRNTIISFPQSYIYSDSKSAKAKQKEFVNLSKKCRKLILAAREKNTYDLYRNLFVDYDFIKILLVPDIVFSMEVKRVPVLERHDRAMLILRNDKEKNTKNIDSGIIKSIVSRHFKNCIEMDTCSSIPDNCNRYEFLEYFLDEIGRSKLVVTDRLHGMIMAYITKTPCIVMKNNNNKIQSTYETWLADCKGIFLFDGVDSELLNNLIVQSRNLFDETVQVDKGLEQFRLEILRNVEGE